MPLFKLDFLKIKFEWKIQFLEIELCEIKLKKKKKHMELKFHIKFLTLLNFHQIE